MNQLSRTALLVLCVLPTACQSAPSLRLLAYNIHHGAGVDGRLDLDRIARVIRESRADVVTLQEVDLNTRRTLGVDQARALGERLGMQHRFGQFMPYQGGFYGMAILSHLPILSHTNHALPPGPEPRTTLTARIQLPDGGPQLLVASIHFYRTEAERLAQARATVAALAGEPGPVVLAGDFNSRPGDPVMVMLAETFTEVPKAAPSHTFPSPAPDHEIDYFLVRPAARFVGSTARVLDERVASDHRPILLELRLR
jgi:endonuclease/exonuclease/phosphatase family metal-dependent hydrolase